MRPERVNKWPNSMTYDDDDDDANEVDTDLPVATPNKTAECPTGKLQTNTGHKKNAGTQERKVQTLLLFLIYINWVIV